MRKYRVGIAAMVHDHLWGELAHWSKLENAEIVAAGDENEELRAKVQAEYGVPKLYSSWQEMIESEELDIVQAAAPNNAGAEIVEACAAKGIHVISEKPMAARLEQADRMLAAAEKAGAKLMINWPTAWQPSIYWMLEMIRDGAIGDLFYLKYRAAHNGPKEIGCSEYFWKWLYDQEQNGAGALMDYCCYSSVMNSYLLGLPKRCIGFRATLVKDYPIPDDNAMIIMHYPHAVGVAEASWTQKTETWTPNPLAYGSEGSIGVLHGKIVLHQEGKGTKEIDPAPMPEGFTSGPQHLLACIETGEEIRGVCNPEISRDAQAILEAGLLSADRGQPITPQPY
ncbi:MAG: Gfo/Idh/MocA family oxidoreductase [Armatimonadetes bacterium]|jgi:predicted dehydrogenase|nr:Gfo/Idh/MocA family oxidoreductase [Armatimonadota bacterium]MDI9603273.1 Gfo/Idh/MocA family oxidoreductase [Acidobacteriota bacterium]